MIVLRLDVEAQIGSAVGVNVAAGVLLLFFSFLYRGRKIGLRSPGFETRVLNVRNLRR